jgi:hypothetical protein
MHESYLILLVLDLLTSSWKLQECDPQGCSSEESMPSDQSVSSCMLIQDDSHVAVTTFVLPFLSFSTFGA